MDSDDGNFIAARCILLANLSKNYLLSVSLL